MALCVGLSTFADLLVGKTVVLYSDNKGAEASVSFLLLRGALLAFALCNQAATAAGRARSWDHSMLVHQIWTHAILNRMRLWVERVPSHDNISDDPSRECYSLMKAFGATWRKQVLAAVYDAEHPLGSLDTLALHVDKLRAQCAHV